MSSYAFNEYVVEYNKETQEVVLENGKKIKYDVFIKEELKSRNNYN
jgi:hypothetical protein